MNKKGFIAIGLVGITFIILIFTFYLPLSKSPNSKIDPFIPDNKAIYGIDISHHQGIISWYEVKDWEGNEIKFVYIKATEGATNIDTMYSRNMAEARKFQFLVGSYHYFRTTSSPQEQFDNFKKVVQKDSQDLIPLVDVEEKKNWDDKVFHKNLAQFLNLVENYFGKKPLIYSVNSFYNFNLAGKYNGYNILIGRYGKNSPNMKDKRDWSIWQFSETGRVKGIPKPVDIDVLNERFNLDSLLLNN
jgi:lysozyme